MFKATYKTMKRFVSEMFRCTRLGKINAEEDSHIEGCVKPNIQQKYDLNSKTSPLGYSDMFLAQWKIMKASLEGSVPDGVCYQGFKTFNTKEIHHHLGLYISHVISP